ncbi:MAG: UDP-2,3-diacylglucosamine diphosphatase [Candidatus Cardinium sp.]|nr:UDP-2,3-diacylglucosamine diphosphatase [Candidatus Cardinium sp.]
MIQITQLQKGKKIFFISDLHLPLQMSSKTNNSCREDKVIAWLNYIQPQAEALFLLGDIFDFWFEYKYLIPKGALRFQAKLLSFCEEKIPVYFFLGNHDYWAKDYLMHVSGVQIFRAPLSVCICNKRFLIGHGDTINPTRSYSLLLKLYHNALLQHLAKLLPADWLYGMVDYYCLKKNNRKKDWDLGQEDRILHYCKTEIEPSMHHDFYIFGHMHTPCIKAINHTSYYCNLGDWITHYTYGCFDGLVFSLLKF